MTKAQREYTQQYVTVAQSPAQRRAGSFSQTIYLVTHNPLMATERRKIVTTAKSYHDAAIIAQGYAQSAGIKLSSAVEVY